MRRRHPRWMIPELLISASDRRSHIGSRSTAQIPCSARRPDQSPLVPLGVGWLAGWIIVVGRLPLHLGRVGNMHSAPRDSTCSGVRCRLSHLSLLMDMQAPLGCRRRGGVGRPTSDSPDQLLQNMRRCIRVGGGAPSVSWAFHHCAEGWEATGGWPAAGGAKRLEDDGGG